MVWSVAFVLFLGVFLPSVTQLTYYLRSPSCTTFIFSGSDIIGVIWDPSFQKFGVLQLAHIAVQDFV